MQVIRSMWKIVNKVRLSEEVWPTACGLMISGFQQIWGIIINEICGGEVGITWLVADQDNRNTLRFSSVLAPLSMVQEAAL